MRETALKCATVGVSKEVDLATNGVALRTGNPKGREVPCSKANVYVIMLC